ncbi:MAG: 4-hydroxy-3-methylbut-2-enyl diphosphate reductase [Flavobacteriales bacterium]|jgi:4-hydroxy-3-methylbut-2-enyl diphosphate reductase|nr:4-hydroxy-3-methylbut-2-enyl diphosphate reductase [Flavobacteriales bacterium]
MKQFDVPPFYRSSLIGEIKNKRKLEDPRKKDFTPTQVQVGDLTFYIARHFGFCYGVENAIEKSYKAIKDHPEKRIFLLSQMIHNPDVNEDLESHGLKFLQDTYGKQLIPFDELTSDDIVIIPAFGTTVEIENLLKEKGIEIDTYNTTCPFVEKVWNRSAKLSETSHTIIIHGKANHEETRATFSHSSQNAPSLIIKDIHEAKILGEIISGKRKMEEFHSLFKGKYTKDFHPETDLMKIGVVNQTTMLATETQEITDFLRKVMIEVHGESTIKEHMADTRDTLCYATNDNQSATYGLLDESIDLSIVVGGYNSSNTTHLVELLDAKFNTYYIRNEQEIIDHNQIYSYDIHNKKRSLKPNFLPAKKKINIAITSGASCPDKLVDDVIHKIIKLKNLDSNSLKIIL